MNLEVNRVGRRALGACLLLSGLAFGAVLTGTVRDRFGDPVEGALARLAVMTEGEVACGFNPAVDSVRTDSEGRFRFESPTLAGFHEVLASHDELGAACDFAEVTGAAPFLELAINGPGSLGAIRGIALTQGKPQVRISRVRFILSKEYLDLDTLETDSSGRFSLENLEPDPAYTIRVMDTRLERRSYFFYDLQPGETRLARMELAPAVPRTGNASITGKVIDRVTSEPLRDALIRLEEKAARDLPIRDSTRTDAEGNYSFTGLPETGDKGGPGFGYIVIAGKDRYNVEASGIVPLKDGEKKTVDLSLSRILMIRLRVRESASGGGIAGANAVILRAGEEFPYNHALTDSAGGILFGQFQPGPVRISVAKPGYRTRSLIKTLDGMAWEDTAEVALDRDVPATSRSLHGKVTDPAGKPAVVHLFFSCAATGGEAWLHAVPGGDGNYVLAGIPAECAEGYLHTYGSPKAAVSLTGADTRLDLVRTPITTSIRKGPARRAIASGKGAGGGGRDVLGRLQPGGRPGGDGAGRFREPAR